MGLVVDTSAIMAILLNEPGNAQLIDHLEAASPCLMSAATRVELGIVAEARLGPRAGDLLHRILRDTAVTIADVDADAADRALSAWRRFGKGRHRAGLNFGDCFAYALADSTGYPLLCTGDDFPATDITTIRAVPR
jgi:ribonuclease VapC